MWAETSKWRFAKTMPKNPHYYTLRRDQNEEIFIHVVEHIREYGYKAKFKGNTYTQLHIGNYFYWTMGFPLDMTKLINRKPVSDLTASDVPLDIFN